MGCADQQSKGKGERERGQEIVTTVAYSGARALREHVLACLPGVIRLLLFYYLLCRFNANLYFCFILLFTSSSPCCKEQFAVSYFSSQKLVIT